MTEITMKDNVDDEFEWNLCGQEDVTEKSDQFTRIQNIYQDIPPNNATSIFRSIYQRIMFSNYSDFSSTTCTKSRFWKLEDDRMTHDDIHSGFLTIRH